jgi:hypothetical protein
MNKLITAAFLAATVLAAPAFAATEQQNKMASCNKEAAGKKGDDRKAFMSECLSSKPKVSSAQKAQQDKMKTCNAEAKGKKGDDRKAFMSECLKKG